MSQPSAPTSSAAGGSTRQARPRRTAWPSRAFVRFVTRRLASLLLLAIGVTFVAFVLTQLVPGDPALANLGQDATPEAIAAYHQRHDLDDPLPQQYGHYLERMLHGDLGESQQTHNPVTDDLRALIPATAELALLSVLIAAIVGIGFGVLAALWRDRPLDYVLRAVSLSGVSVPTFWLALVAIYVLFFRVAIFPGGDRLDAGVAPPPSVTGFYTIDSVLAGDWATLADALGHLMLPALVLAAFNVGVLLRYTRAAVLEVIDQDYIRAARAKGLPERSIILGHVLRAALPTIVTVAGMMFANAMTGAVLVESIFSWPGVGQYGYVAATSLDLPAIMGVSLFVAVVYIVVNFLVDVLYGVLDPRVRLT